jgi:hypothetical protein
MRLCSVGATEGGSNGISEMLNMKHCIPDVTNTLPISLFIHKFSRHLQKACACKFYSLNDDDIENYNFARRFVWVWNLVADTEGRTQAEGVWE